MVRWRQYLVVAVLMLGAALSGFEYRGVVDYRDIMDSTQLVVQTRSENQELTSRISDQEIKLADQQIQLSSVQAALHAIRPDEDTFNVNPNQAITIAGRRLAIALVGSPTNEGIKINVNGKQHTATAGDVIHVALDSSTNCEIGVQSFDMFKAVLTASCAGVTPR